MSGSWNAFDVTEDTFKFMKIKLIFVIGVLCTSTVFAKSVENVELSRIQQIANTGKYVKRSVTKPDKRVLSKGNHKRSNTSSGTGKNLKNKKAKKVNANKHNHRLVSKAKNPSRPKNKNKTAKSAKIVKVSKTTNAVHSKKKIKKSRRNNTTFCLGGSYRALSKKSKQHDKAISKYSKKYNVPKALIKAVITAESCFNSKAVSPKGAEGLMQLMPPTARRFGVKDSFNPDSNIRGGTRYLNFLMKHFKQDLLYVIAAYNAGEGAVKKHKGVPPYKETRNYVSKVAALYKLYGRGNGELTLASVASLSNARLMRTIFVPRALPRSRFSPYKGRTRNISHGQCANRTSTRLRKSTKVESGNGIWQRIYRVKSGDTLMRVMQQTGVHKSKIRQMNGLKSRARLKAGQQLLVWECRRK